MNISNINFNNIVPSFGSGGVKRNLTSAGLVSQPDADVFVKKTAVSAQKSEAVKSADALSDKEARIYKLYDEVYDEVLADMVKTNPVIEELNLEKPKLLIENYSDEEDKGVYNFASNSISLSRSFVDNNYTYALVSRDADGELNDFFGFSTDKSLEDDLQTLSEDDNIAEPEVMSLSQEEQDLVLKETFAHELRHFVQLHLIASVEGCREPHIEMTDLRLQRIKESQEEYLAACEEAGIEPREDLLKPMPDYYKNYQPKKMLPSDTLLKLSKDEEDNRYLSVKEHLFASEMKDAERQGDNYLSSTLEIDAYNYGYEYVMSNLSKPGIRDEVIIGLIIGSQKHVQLGTELMRSDGADFIYK